MVSLRTRAIGYVVALTLVIVLRLVRDDGAQDVETTTTALLNIATDCTINNEARYVSTIASQSDFADDIVVASIFARENAHQRCSLVTDAWGFQMRHFHVFAEPGITHFCQLPLHLVKAAEAGAGLPWEFALSAMALRVLFNESATTAAAAQWFLLAPFDVFVHVPRLVALARSVNASQKWAMGAVAGTPGGCSLRTGVLMSRALVSALQPHLVALQSRPPPANASATASAEDVFGEALRAAGAACTAHAGFLTASLSEILASGRVRDVDAGLFERLKSPIALPARRVPTLPWNRSELRTLRFLYNLVDGGLDYLPTAALDSPAEGLERLMSRRGLVP